MSADVSLCLFRIVEEALGNVVRHGQAPEALVTLEEIDREIGAAARRPGSQIRLWTREVLDKQATFAYP